MKVSLTRFFRIAQRLIRLNFNDGLVWPRKLSIDNGNFGAESPRVLVATSVAGHLTALNFEGVIAKSLAVRGASVTALLCDQALPACMDCEHRFYPTATARQKLVDRGPKELCISCTRVGKNMYGQLGIDVIQYREYLTAPDFSNVEKISKTIGNEDIRKYKIDNLPVGEHAYAGTLRFLARGEIGDEPLGYEILRRYFEAALLTVFMMRNLLSAQKFDVCLLNHGIYVPQGLVGEVCREQGVRVVTWNPAYRKSCFILSHETTYHHTLMTEPVTSWENVRLSKNIEKSLMQYLQSRMNGTQDWIWFHDKPQFDIEGIQKEIGINFSNPTIGLLTNVIWDAQLHYPANAFSSMTEWIIETIRWFAGHPNLQLVIRVHPAEIRGTLPSRQRVLDEITKHFPRLPANVFVIPPESQASTYAVMSQCDSVIIYGTKTGVELTSIGIPVIVAGEAWIRGKGVTLDASSISDYCAILDQLPIGRKMPLVQIQRARRYAFHFFYRRMIPLPFMHARKGWPSIAPDIDDINKLLPGNFEGLDIICEGILTGSPFIYPAEQYLESI